MAKVGKFCLAKRVKVEWLFHGDTGTFFRRKITAGNFLYENRRPERERYRPPSYLLRGT